LAEEESEVNELIEIQDLLADDDEDEFSVSYCGTFKIKY